MEAANRQAEPRFRLAVYRRTFIVSLIGAHGPVGRGTGHPEKAQPVDSVLRIEDESHPFLTVESATQVRGIQFWYPKHTLSDASKIVSFPAAIRVSPERYARGVTLSGRRMRNYVAQHPLTLDNPLATVRAIACLDRDERWFEGKWEPVNGSE